VDSIEKLKKQSKLKYFLTISFSVSFLIALPTIFLLLVGMGLDAYFHKKPLFAIIGAAVGFVSSFYNIYKLLKRLT
jgi:F0F1-type ATP synthase assembly protein I